jgi:hypothetical protein
MPDNIDAAHGGATPLPLAYPLAVLAALALVTASAGFGAYFAWTSNAHHAPALAVFAVVMALGLELAKPLAVHGLFDALRRWQFGQALALMLLATVAIGYSLTAELNLMARSRADAIADRANDSGTATEARGKLAALRAELATVAPARSVAEIEALTAPKVAATRGTDCSAYIADAKIRTACAELSMLKAEAARRETRADLRERIEAAEHAVARAGAVRVADPSAVALSTFLEAFGVRVSPGRLGDWFTLIGVFALEAGSMFAAVLVSALRPNMERTPTQSVPALGAAVTLGNTGRDTETPALPPPAPQETPSEGTPVPSVPSEPVKLAVSSDPAERMLDLLRQRGGNVFGSQRALAQLVGISAAHCNRLVRDLETAGKVSVAADKSGTRLALV